MTGDEIRELFLTYFEGRGHLRMPSASLVPAGDPTLLFTSAGMVPFKPFFMGEQRPPSPRLASSQKSFRTTDIDEVGDHTHLTFFEMLGNFSIGDYFKEKAIALAWEFVTSASGGFGLPGERFFATVHHTDDEAYDLWRGMIGLGSDRVFRYGDSDNWWGPAGQEGPCGPCSELHYDFGFERGCGRPLTHSVDGGEGCHPNHECERFVELWNLVFMQFYQDAEGNRTPLPAPSVDTGMGLERAALVTQGPRSIYDTDLFRPLIETASELCGRVYGRDEDTDYALRVIAEHARAVAFLISDGVAPGNAGRGYVLRRIVRRAVRYGRRLGLEEAFLARVTDAAITHFGRAYPDLAVNREFILRVVNLEEERFSQTIEVGIPLLERGLIPLRLGLAEILSDGAAGDRDEVMARIDALAAEVGPYIRPQSILEEIVAEASEGLDAPDSPDGAAPALSGREVFVLHDTFGFPKELTQEIAREHGLGIDEEGFESELRAHRERARAAHVTAAGMEIQTRYAGLVVRPVKFLGYGDDLRQSSTVAALLSGDGPVSRVVQGQEAEVVLSETPFYAEAGGQVGDVGTITGPNGLFSVRDTQSPVAGVIVHRGAVVEGHLSLGDPVTAEVEVVSRADTARNHSGTHLLHAALRSVLGSHVRQAGSLVSPRRLRFDYSHVGSPTREELGEIQSLVNRKTVEDMRVSTHETTYAEGVREGALAFFGDKYGDRVRVVTMAGRGDASPFSVELCGGSHVGATGEVGPLFILGDSGIGGGMRRVEAVTGEASERLFRERTDLLQRISSRLDTPVVDLEERLEGFMSEVSALRKRVAQLERQSLRAEAEGLLAQARRVKGVNVLAARTSAASVEALREMGDWLRDRLSSAVLVLALAQKGSALLVCMVTPDLVGRGLHAGDIVREAAQVMGGGGGGRAESAQAGGKRLEKLAEALERVAEIVSREVKS